MESMIDDVAERLIVNLQSGSVKCSLDGLPDITHYCHTCEVDTDQTFLCSDYRLSDSVFVISRDHLCVVDYQCLNCDNVHTYVYDMKTSKVL